MELDELVEHWTLLVDEQELIAGKRGSTRLGFALSLKFYVRLGRFPRGRSELPDEAVAFVAKQVGVPPGELGFYEWAGSTIGYHRSQIRAHLGFRVSGRLMLHALIDSNGTADPTVMADLAKRRMRSKIPVLTEALNGRFTAHHAFMTRLFLDRIDGHTKDIEILSERIDELMKPFLPARVLLESIPGFSQTIAEVFIADDRRGQ